MGEIPALWVLQLPQAELAPPQGHPCRDSPISFPWCWLIKTLPWRRQDCGSSTQPAAPLVSSLRCRATAGETSKGLWGWDPLESISCPGRPQQPLENGMRAKVFLYPPDKSTELPGI